jgi:hypothetical protein
LFGGLGVTEDLTAGLSQHGTELAGCIQVGDILDMEFVALNRTLVLRSKF